MKPLLSRGFTRFQTRNFGLEIFATVARHQLHRNGALVQTFEPELTTQQLQVLDLLGLAPTAYA